MNCEQVFFAVLLVVSLREIKIGICNDAYMINGNNTANGSTPWMVRLFSRDNPKITLCGGVLINDRWVLTAAHCVLEIDRSTLTVGLGDYDVTNRNSSRTVGAMTILYHRKYKQDPGPSAGNDIAIMKLVEKVSGNNISPADLPTPGQSFEGHIGTVYGWGMTSTDKDSSAVVNQYIIVRVISNENCQRLVSTHGDTIKNVVIDDTMMCAGVEDASGKIGDGKSDVCYGDSGGPLVFQWNGKTTVVGLVSFGEPCAKKDVPSIYARVSNFLDWIHKAIEAYP